MHIQKYKSQAIGNMIGHYERRSEGTRKRENIDVSKTPSNYQIRNGYFVMDEQIRKLVEFVQEDSGRKVRKDAVLMADIVITLPKNVPVNDSRLFFKESCVFIFEELKKRGMLDLAAIKGYVHLDESTPHCHLVFTPICKNDKGKLSFNYKKLVTREFYQHLHQDLRDHLTSILGYSPDLILDGENRLRSLSKLDQETFKKAKEEVNGQILIQKQKVKEVLDAKKVLDASSKKLENEIQCLKKKKENLNISLQWTESDLMNWKIKRKKKKEDLKKQTENLNIVISNCKKLEVERMSLEAQLKNLKNY